MKRLLALLLAAPLAHAETIAGTASVVDGDTLHFTNGAKIRLWGIDAPEKGQPCGEPGKEWRCGQKAALALSDKIGRGTVTCDVKDVDRYRRSVAVCSSGGVDLNAWLVREGWAVNVDKYSGGKYAAEQASARNRAIGIHRSSFELPEEFRSRPRAPRR